VVDEHRDRSDDLQSESRHKQAFPPPAALIRIYFFSLFTNIAGIL
jgi:hypothetical protein